MSTFMFNPAPNFGRSEHPFTTWNDGFSDEEIKRLIAAGEVRVTTPATVGSGTVETCIRESRVSWLEESTDTRWVYERMAFIIQQLNGQFYGFDLFGFCEHMQYTEYDGAANGHYNWHQDSGVASKGSPRKLSAVIQLSDPASYEGGELQILTGADPIVITRQKGLVAVFPSYMVHRVTPVTSGFRRSLVVWTTGPSFV